jgi:DNA invertase Pin-like site-specific DNA recombinase
MAEREGWDVVGEFHDEGFSAYKGNRGPGLEQAKTAAADAAERYGTDAMLIVQHSDRLARGAGDAPGAADHLGEVYFWARRHRIRLRSAEDDANLEDPLRAVLIGERNTEDSRRKSKAVAAGLRGAAERGDWVGGILCDGYRVVRGHDEHGRETRTIEFDPDREEIYHLMWDLHRRGYSAAAIVLELDRRGYRTNPRKRNHRPRLFDANRVRQTLRNPFYAGLAYLKGEFIGPGSWPAYVPPKEFERLKTERRRRSNADRRGPGRPPEGYLLARLAACGACGSRMQTETARQPTTAGVYRRRYVCTRHRERPHDCSAKPIDANTIDAAVIENLPAILGDIEGMRSSLAAARGVDRSRLEARVEEAHTDVQAADRTMEEMANRVVSLYEQGEGDKAAALEEALAHARKRQHAAQAQLAGATGALMDAPEPSEDADAVFWERLYDAVATRLDSARDDLKRLNLALVDFLEAVALRRLADGSIQVTPQLSATACERILRDIERWPHEVDTNRSGEPTISDLRFDALLFRKDDNGDDVFDGVSGPPSFVASSLENPHTPL